MIISQMRSDFYRMKVTKAVRILLIIYLVYTVICVIGMGFLYGDADWIEKLLKAIEPRDEDSVLSLSILRESFSELYGRPESLCSFVSRGFLWQSLVFTVIFSAVFSIAPYRTSFIKNYRTEVTNRAITVSMLATLYVFTAVLCLAGFITPLLFMKLFFSKDVPFGNFISLVAFFVVKHLLLYASGLLFMTFSMLVRRPTAAIVISIIYSVWLANSIYTIADTIMKIFMELKHSISEFTPVGNLFKMEFEDHPRYYLAFFMAAALILLLYYALNRIVSRKDIN